MSEIPHEKNVEFKINSLRRNLQDKPQMAKDSNGNCQYFFSSEHIKIWEKKGVIPEDLVDNFFKMLNKMREEHLRLKEFKTKHPTPTWEEMKAFLGIPRVCTQEESDQMRKDIEMSIKFHEFLRGNWEKLISSLEEEADNEGLFNNVSDDDKMGIVRLITDSMYHLNKLLKEATLSLLYDNFYEAKSVIQNSKGEDISLIFSFPASSQEEAVKTFGEYKKIMIGKGLKIWMAHWGLANDLGRTEYSCQMIDVMKMLAENDRQRHFSVKEKQEHWTITKMLGMTKLLREHAVRKKGTNTFITRWMEQPLLEILGGEKEAEAGDKYLEAITVRVLVPQVDMKGFVPAIYNKATYRLHPSDASLAFVIQTRAAQRNRGETELKFDWKFLFEVGNLERTAQSNQRVAKAIARKKMDKFQKEEIIERWDEESAGMRITPKSQKKRNEN